MSTLSPLHLRTVTITREMVADEQTSTSISLTNTLSLALAQSQSLVWLLEEKTNIIARLQEDNIKLRQELAELHTKADIPREKLSYPNEFEQFFKISAEKQAEIDVQNDKLKDKQIQKSICHSHMHTPLAARDPSESESSPEVNRRKLDKVGDIERPLSFQDKVTGELVHQNLTRKRRRSLCEEDARSLKDFLANQHVSAAEDISLSLKPRNVSGKDRQIIIKPVTEDGDNYENDHQRCKRREDKTNHHVQPFKRPDHLQALLSNTVSVNLTLSEAQTPSAKSSSLIATPESDPTRPSYQSRSFNTPSSDPGLRRPRSIPIEPNTTIAPRSKGKTQTPPSSRLNLRHFKTKPQTKTGHKHALTELSSMPSFKRCTSGCTRPECCTPEFKPIASALLERTQSIRSPTDNDLLLEFLGPGSEDKIRSLTTTARKNLVHEARAKKLAAMYEKLHRNTTARGLSPPGFWDAEMPGTQEDIKRREIEELQKW